MTDQKNQRRSKTEQAEVISTRPKARWGRRIGIFLLLLLVLVFFLPTILLQTSLKQKAIDWATADLNGNLKVKQASAGWFSPVKLSGIELTDEAGGTVATVGEIVLDKSLLKLATASDYGTVRIVRPTLDFKIRQDGSNLEDVLENYLATSDDQSVETEASPFEIPKVNIEVVEGAIQVQSAGDDRVWLFDDLDVTAQLSSDLAPVAAELQCNAKSNAQEAGTISLRAVVDQGASQLALQQIESSVQTEKFPMASLSPLLKRFVGPIDCVGQMDGQLELAADMNSSTVAVDVNQFNLKEFIVVAPEYLKGDRFAARNLTARGRLNLSPTEIYAEKFETESEFARFNADGQFNVNQIMGLMNQGELPSANFQMDGVVDLAQMVAMLPETIGMREGVEVKSGLVQVHANTRNENGTQRMVFNLDTANINASQGGQAILWQQPLRVAGSVVQRNGQLVLETVECSSEFLKVNGQATIQSGKFTTSGDLAKLTAQVGQLIDLSDLELAGTLSGGFGWQMAEAPAGTSPLSLVNRPIKIEGDFVIADPVVRLPGMNRWNEKRLDLNLKALGRSNADGQIGLEDGWAQCKFGTETALAKLNRPIPNITENQAWQFSCDVTGGIGNWLAQARNFVELPEFVANGDMQTKFLFTMTPNQVRINQLALEATNLDFNGFAMSIREPKLNFNGNFDYDLQTGQIDIGNFQLTSGAVAAGGEKLAINVGEKILIDGSVAFRANANRTSQWFGFSLPGDSVQWNGDAEGLMAFTSEQNAFGGELTAKVNQLAFYQLEKDPNAATAPGATTRQVSGEQAFTEFWREEKVDLKTKFFLADDFDSVRLGGLQVDSKMADIQGHGTIADLAGSVQADLKGQWNLDWEQITKLAQASAGDVVNFQGGAWQPFEVRGPLLPGTMANGTAAQFVDQKLIAKTSVGWKNANVMQMPLGPNTIEIDLVEAIAGMKSQSQESVVGQVFALRPVIDLRSASPTLNVNEGNLLQNWQITENDSRTWLKYFAPIIADATSVQGQITVASNGAQVPLFDPMKVSAQGTVSLGELVVGAGPLTQQLLPMMDQLLAVIKPGSSSLQDKTTWLRIKPQNVRYAVQDGRVYHDNMQFNYKDIPIRTRGNVGFDQTMNMVAEIPILDKWLEDQPYLVGLKGQSIQIPIGGTVTKPKLDKNAIRKLTQQLVQQSARGAVNNVVNKEVGKLQSKATEKIGGELNKLQERFGNKLQERLGGKLQEQLGGGQTQGTTEGGPAAELGGKLENELRNGLNNLFKKR